MFYHNAAGFRSASLERKAKTQGMKSGRRGVYRSSLQKVREFELEEARLIQQAMVPVEPLRAHSVEFASKFRPVAEVSGDFLDYFLLADRRVAFYLGDVVGKGLPAALYAALAVGTLRGIHKTGQAPSAVLELFNERLRVRLLPGRYCALQYGVFDPRSSELWYANAGLPRPLHISAKSCREVGEGGLPSGLFPNARYEQYTIRLASGDALLFVTDGIVDSVDPSGEQFGLERLVEVCGQNGNESATTLLARIFEAVDAFGAGARQYDDITAAVLKLA